MGGRSWLSAVKRALRSPSIGSEKKCEQEEEYHKKREKRRWIFSKPQERRIEHKENGEIDSPCNSRTTRKSTDQRQLQYRLSNFNEEEAEKTLSFAMAMATSAATAAIASAHAAVEVVRLTTPSTIFVEYYAAVAIQSAFRGYLAKRALQALKGVVKFQAFIRGYIVRKRAKTTLRYMQSLLRVQSQVCYQRKRLSTDCNFRHSTSSVTADVVHRHKFKDAKLKRERTLAYASSHQQEKASERSDRTKEVEIVTSTPRSSLFPQNLLMNSLASPRRSRIRTLKTQSRDPEEEETIYSSNGACSGRGGS